MLISFLKKEESGESSSKFMGKGDIIFLLVLATLIFGFWYYYNYSKEKAYSHYARCDVLFKADSLIAARECYESAINLGYRIDSLEKIGYKRVESIDSIDGFRELRR
ncbi:MAG: hypothetical protein LBC64_11610 [Fibromonadaceae bacterium]|jgi:hypothetical protein|nr:hypothetical protein [Fibromonadaceae bacterium]